MEHRQGVGLSLRQAVAADQHRKKIHHVEFLQQAPRGRRALVGHHAERNAPLAQALQLLENAVEQVGVDAQALLVDRHEFFEERVHLFAFAFLGRGDAEAVRDHRPSALRYRRAQGPVAFIDPVHAPPLKHSIEGAAQILACARQRAVQVEQTHPRRR